MLACCSGTPAKLPCLGDGMPVKGAHTHPTRCTMQVVRGEVSQGQLPQLAAYLDAARARSAEKGDVPSHMRGICAGVDCDYDSLLQARARKRAGAAGSGGGDPMGQAA